MAKKNGIELRELSILPGKDDILYSGNLYVDGIKIAFWKQKGDGISDEITMEEGFSEKKFFAYLKKYPNFVQELLLLSLDEMQYQEYCSHGYQTMVVATDLESNTAQYFAFRDASKMTFSALVQKCKKQLYGNDTSYAFQVYTSPGDFRAKGKLSSTIFSA